MTAVARVWDKDATLRFTLDEAPTAVLPDERTTVLPISHEAAKWLYRGAEEPKFSALLTVDDENGRWAAPLDYFKVERNEDRDTVISAVWRAPEPLRGHDFGTLVPS